MTEALKSASIANLDTVPPVANSAGEGGPAYGLDLADYVTATAAGLVVGSTYKLLRVPSTVKLKQLDVMSVATLDSNGAPTLKLDIGAYYSDSTSDQTPVSLQGTLISANALGAALAFAQNALLATRTIDGLSALSFDKRNQPLWQALGLSADPGGMIDIVATVNANAATGVAGQIGARLRFTQ